MEREIFVRWLYDSAESVMKTGLSWEQTSDRQKEGLAQQAEFLLARFEIIPKGADPEGDGNLAGIKAIITEIQDEYRRAQIKHPGRICTRHQAWGIIEEEFDKFNGAVIMNDYGRARAKLISTAAMCLRTLMDWGLIQKVESDLTILHRLDTPEVERAE